MKPCLSALNSFYILGKCSQLFSLCILVDSASSTDVDQSTCQETLENLVQAFQKVVDLQSRVSCHSNIKPRPNDRNIVGRNMLRAFGHLVATCCDVLGVAGSSLKLVKLEPTTPNMSQHVATGWPNARNMLRPTMLRYVALTCCDRLAGD